MRAKEFIRETKKNGKMPDNLKQSSQGATIMRDKGGYDRAYHMNRMGMALAMADGQSKRPVEMDASSFVEKYNVAFPYSDVEHLMMLQAMATIPTDSKELLKRSKSEEPTDTNVNSPVSDWNPRNKSK